MDIIKLDNVCLNYFTKTGETEALKNISFSVNEGDFVSVVGPSGCGKTTLLSAISGLLSPQSGKIFYNHNGINSETIPKNFFGYMLQSDELFPWLSVYKNIILPLEIQKIKTKENLDYIENLLKKYGLENFKNKKPNELSGGMRQRVALIRTLALRPKVLLLDEPFSALDYVTRISVANDVAEIIREEHKTAILVTHDIEEAVSLSNKIVILTKRPATIKEVALLPFKENESITDRRENFHLSEWQAKIFD